MPEIIPLQEWAPTLARKWDSVRVRKLAPHPRLGYTVHHTGGIRLDPADYHDELAYLTDVAWWHWRKWSRPGGYNFAVADDDSGRIFEMCGWRYRGAHAGVHAANRDTVGVALVGNYSHHDPTLDGLATLKWLLSEGLRLGEVQVDPDIYGHRDWKATACPGDRLYPSIVALEVRLMPETHHDRNSWRTQHADPFGMPGWAQELWQRYLEADGSSVPESAVWSAQRYDLAWVFMKFIQPLRNEIGRLRAELDALNDRFPSPPT